MKKLHFKTGKGDFMIVEDDGNFPRDLPHDFYEKIGYIGQLTEERAKQIVDNIKSGTVLGKLVTKLDDERIDIYTHERASTRFLSAINCLISLLKANDVHFENPYPDVGLIPSYEQKLYRDFKDKVYNKSKTYLFRKI